MRKETTLARIELQRNEEIILAEGALRRERIVAVTRIMAIVAWTASMTVASLAKNDEPDHLRPFIAAAYLAWAVGNYRALRRAELERRDASWLRASTFWPVAIPFFDAAFNLALFLVPSAPIETLPALHRERVAITFALLIVFSVARSSGRHVLFSAVLATLCYFWTVYAPSRLYGVGPVPLHRGGDDLELYVSSIYIIVGYGLLALIVYWTQRMLRDDFANLRRLDNLKRFLPGPIAERIRSMGEGSLRPVHREVTVLFSDIRDFTTLCERMDPKAVLELLDFYFGHMTQIVKGRDGIVNKFIGDGLLAFWGVPEPNDAHAEAALMAALDMRRKIQELNDQRTREGLPPLRIGVGVHTGLVAAGMLGGADQHEYTVIGDAVNVASRVEGLNKVHGTDILVTESTWRLVEGRFVGERLGEEHVKGRAQPVAVYRLVERASDRAAA